MQKFRQIWEGVRAACDPSWRRFGFGGGGIAVSGRRRGSRLSAKRQAAPVGACLVFDIDERLRQVVELKFFAGLSETEIAEFLGVTTRTVERDWVKARLFLLRELEQPEP